MYAPFRGLTYRERWRMWIRYAVANGSTPTLGPVGIYILKPAIIIQKTSIQIPGKKEKKKSKQDRPRMTRRVSRWGNERGGINSVPHRPGMLSYYCMLYRCRTSSLFEFLEDHVSVILQLRRSLRQPCERTISGVVI